MIAFTSPRCAVVFQESVRKAATRSTSIRAECWNTVSAGAAEGKRLGTDFSIRHTEKWADRVDDAKKALKGLRRDIETYREVMEEFATVPVTRAARDLFVQALVLDQKVASVPRFKADVAKGAYSTRVQNNVERAVASAKALFNGKTIPVTVSIGVATAGPGDLVVTALIQRADDALYQAKRSGRDRCSTAGAPTASVA